MKQGDCDARGELPVFDLFFFSTEHGVMGEVIAVLGATGVYGRHLLPRLMAAGHRVRALVRDPQRATVAAASGAEIVQADIFDDSALQQGLEGCSVAINLATSLPGPRDVGGTFERTNSLRREGTPIWVRACAHAGVARILQQSIALIHAGGGDLIVDEGQFFERKDSFADDAIRAVHAMETTVQESALDWSILRGGLFYGPGTGLDEEWFSRARAGKLRLPDDGESFVSLIHVADMAAATVAAVSRWPSRQALIVSDDRPARWREIFTYVCAASSVEAPKPGGRNLMPSFRVSNRRVKDALAWAPLYANFAVGLAR